MIDKIIVRGAREHNLKDINVEIEKNKITVITGLSGSGKSSLAFDTIYAEGQRRFIDSLSTYARNFLLQLNKPDVDSITGLCPSIAIDQKTIGHSPRSTVGTVTEVYDYLRLLYAKVGTPRCPTHKIPVEGQALDQINFDILEQYKNKKIIILAPVAKGKKGEFKKEIDGWLKAGYLSAKIDGEWLYLDSVTGLKKNNRHDIEIVVDKLQVKDDEETRHRVSQAISAAVTLTDGLATVETKTGTRKNFSTRFACPECGYSFTNIDPLLFSFNNPKGACEDCNGLGTMDIYEYETSEHISGVGESKSVEYKLDTDNPDMEWKDTATCETCGGSGLKEAALNVFFEDKTIFELSQMSISRLDQFFKEIGNSGDYGEVAEQIIPEIRSRIEYLEKVGAGYLH
jgi:excinuclease ABC subunit A